VSAAPSFPLSAIVGQQQLVRALLIAAVDADIGGVLVRGQRGTAKSTAVRALAPLLQELDGGAAPLVEVPLGATLDRLLGSLDLRRALGGEHRFEPGLLARAHGGILYVDEVNLLSDHLVDALLDAAASGVARIERDAVSVEHEARFLLVGTMNVEEGELRPQLLDRFGLGVEVLGPDDPALRAEIVRRRLAFADDPDAFAHRFASTERELAERIAEARGRLQRVHLPERELLRIAGACARLHIDGVRGDIVWSRAARAQAALEGKDEVDSLHVRDTAPLALAHRRRRDPLESGPGDEELERALEEEPDPPPDDPPAGAGPPPANGGQPAPSRATGPARERRDPPTPARLPLDALRLEHSGRGPRGRRARAGGLDVGSVDSRPAGEDATDLSIVATLRARLLGDATPREHIRSGREGVLLCLVVDASGSMGARRRLARVKGALLALLRDAYARRDRVAIVAFRDGGAQLMVSPGAPLERAAAAIRALPAGGRTPLAAGLDLGAEVVRRESGRDPTRRAIAVVLTDGRVADPTGAARAAAARLGRCAAAVHVIDTEEGAVHIGLAASIAAAASGHLHSLRRAA
jgi:magnesium chelatase subunit D